MPQPGTFLSRATHVRSMERKKVGEVFHFFGHIGVAAIKLTDGSLAVGDTVQIQGPTTKDRPNKRTEKKRAAKKRRAKSPTRARKASRAPRKKARPSSRKSRRRSR